MRNSDLALTAEDELIIFAGNYCGSPVDGYGLVSALYPAIMDLNAANAFIPLYAGSSQSRTTFTEIDLTDMDVPIVIGLEERVAVPALEADAIITHIDRAADDQHSLSSSMAF